MKRIQFDTINGVTEVSMFENFVTMVAEDSIRESLDRAKPGVVYGAVVSDETFDMITDEYGIH